MRPGKRFRKLKLNSDQNRDKRAYDELAGSAYVEKAGLKSEADRQSRHNDRGSVIQSLAYPLGLSGKSALQYDDKPLKRLFGVADKKNNKAEQ
jgi:hypothetical protein